MKFNPSEHPHRRFNPLLGEWVLVSPHRTERPWQGKQEAADGARRPAYDPKCYLCPGNVRANGERNPGYETTFVFVNDFAAVMPNDIRHDAPADELFRSEPAAGECRVICFSPCHDLTLAEMTPDAIVAVIDVWTAQYLELAKRYGWVQVFENKGAIMGCSNPHPHGQVWATREVPSEPAQADAKQLEYFRGHDAPLLIDYVTAELRDGARTVDASDDWLAVVPYWASWPFEILLLPRRHVRHLGELRDAEHRSLAEILKRVLTRYDNLFETSFPYSMGWHQAPGKPACDNADHWQLHAHFYPPLLRSATVKKFMVGYEMLAEAQRDLTPEQAAERLRAAAASPHYNE